jgi:hypothetical protein
MISGRAAALVLALLTALLWAPSAASAVEPNQLVLPEVLPPAGTDDTPITFTVTYLSTANPAYAVEAEAGGVTVSLTLVAGTPTDGVWAGSGTLPAGTWQVEFRAQASSGPQPKVKGPMVTVLAIATPEPPAPTPPAEAVEPDPTAGPAESPVTSGGGPSSTPPGTQGPAATPATPATASPAAPAAPATPGGGGTGAVGPVGGNPAPAASAATAASPPAAPGVEEPPADAAEKAITRGAADSSMLWTVLLVGIGSVGLVALLGIAWVVIAGRSEDDESLAGSAEAAAAAAAAVPLVDRRSVRRARLRPSDDPILAAMGLAEPEEDAATAPPPARKRGRKPR